MQSHTCSIAAPCWLKKCFTVKLRRNKLTFFGQDSDADSRVAQFNERAIPSPPVIFSDKKNVFSTDIAVDKLLFFLQVQKESFVLQSTFNYLFWNKDIKTGTKQRFLPGSSWPGQAASPPPASTGCWSSSCSFLSRCPVNQTSHTPVPWYLKENTFSCG